MLIYANDVMWLLSQDHMICMLMIYMLHYANDIIWLLSHENLMFMLIMLMMSYDYKDF